MTLYLLQDQGGTPNNPRLNKEITMFTKIKLALIILAIMIVTSSILSAQFSGGNGTASDPYLIATAQDLDNIRNHMDNKHFLLIADINLGVEPYNTGEGWERIGSMYTQEFRGTIDGTGHSILNLYINSPDYGIEAQGLFGGAEASIKNLNLVDVDITTNISNVGAIVGMLSYGSISNCTVNGILTGFGACGGLVGGGYFAQIQDCSFSGTVRGRNQVGGIAGSISETQIKQCSVDGNILEHPVYMSEKLGGIVGFASESQISYCDANVNITGYHDEGGIVGSCYDNSSVAYCLASGSISGLDQLGGLVGRANGSQILNSFAHTDVGNISAQRVGGLVGLAEWSTITNSYATGLITYWVSSPYAYSGGLVGESTSSSAIHSYWNSESSGMQNSALGEMRNTAQMTYPYDPDTYVGWNFYLTWEEDGQAQNQGYPILRSSPETLFAGGSGTALYPWQIATAGQLYLTRFFLDDCFVQTADIDLAEAPFDGGWLPIGMLPDQEPAAAMPFTGRYDGNGYMINNLTINLLENQDIGLFWRLDHANISLINIQNANVTGGSRVGALAGHVNMISCGYCTVSGSVSGEDEVGGLFGVMDSGGSISHCSFDGSVDGLGGSIGGLVGTASNPGFESCTFSGSIHGTEDGIGGFVGSSEEAFFTECSADATITGGNSQVGGLIGNSHQDIMIGCTVSGTITNNALQVGGIIGKAQNASVTTTVSLIDIQAGELAGGLIGECSTSVVTNCYSRAQVQAANTAGGFIGSCLGASTISSCYSTGLVGADSNAGGFMGQSSDESMVNYCYWDMESSDMQDSAAGEGMSHAAMTIVPYPDDTYLGFDFDEYWMPDTNADINDGYPYLEYRPVSNDDPSVPVAQELLCIHPNPFNPCTTISFDLAKAAKVSVQIYNVKGQLVHTIIKAELRSGKSSYVWDGRDALENPLPSGLYFCVLKADGKPTVKKMTLLK